jgi:hypothetical protein
MTKYNVTHVTFMAVSVLIAVILLYGAYEIVTEYHRYYFERERQDVDIVLNQVNGIWKFYMNNEECFSTYEAGNFGLVSGQFTSFHVSQYSKGRYGVEASTLPMSLTLRFESGSAAFQAVKAESQETISSTNIITGPSHYTPISVDQVVVDVGEENNISLQQIICAPEVIFSPPYVVSVSSYSWQSLQDSSHSTVLLRYEFLNSAKPITIMLLNALTDAGWFEQILITYNPDLATRPRANVSVGVKGDRLTYYLPTFDTYRISGPITLQSAYVREMELEQIVGTIGYANYQQPLISGISALDRRKLEIGDIDSNFLVFPSTEEDEAYIVSGETSNIIWRDEQIIFNRWQLLSDEVHAALIAAALGLLGWLTLQFVKLWLKVYKTIQAGAPSTAPEQSVTSTKEKHPSRIDIPDGHTVLALRSGTYLAGALYQQSTWYRKKCILRDTYFSFDNKVWQKGPGSVAVDTKQIVYSYINHTSKE